ncbi:MAG: molybdopterin cofactor-binding domain-containing protein, partial [Gammaproteobacteria bacterium]
GGTKANMPWNLGQFGSNTSFTMTRTNFAAGTACKNLLLELAAQVMGGNPADYDLKDEKVVAKAGGASMSFADAAKKAIELGGKYSGAEIDEELNPMTKASAKALAGTGLIAAAKDKLPKKGTVPGLAAAFVEIDLDVETGRVDIIDYLGIPDVGTVLHPKGLAAQVRGAAVMGFGLAALERYVYDPEYGRPNIRGLYQAKPPSYLDIPTTMKATYVEGANDPQNPVGAKGVGEPIQGAASSAYLAAITEALEGHTFNRVPVVKDMIINHLAGLAPSHKPLQVNCQ